MIVFMAFPEKLLHLFAASDAMIRMGVPALRIICVSCIPASVTMIIGYVISGLGNGLVNMTGTAIRQLIVLVPFVYLFGRLGGLDLIWFAFWISELTAVIFAVICLKKAFQKLRQSA